MELGSFMERKTWSERRPLSDDLEVRTVAPPKVRQAEMPSRYHLWLDLH